MLTLSPKSDGDATPLGQSPLSVLPVVYRVWASARMVQLKGWFKSWFLIRFSALVVVGRLRLGIPLLSTLRRFLLALPILMFIFLLLMLLSLSILLIG